MEILCAAPRAIQRCLMVVHTVGNNIAQRGADQSQTMFLGAREAWHSQYPATGRDCR
jgi:hypothetical protein